MTESKPGQNITIDTQGFQFNIVNSQITDTVGAVLLALIALVLALSLMRTRRQNRKLREQLRSIAP